MLPRIAGLIAFAVAWVAVGCGGSPSTTPVGPSGVPAFALTASDVERVTIEGCPSTLQVGQRVVCAAFAHLRTGGTTFVTSYAAWSSTNQATLSVSGPLVFAKSDGSAVVSVNFLGHAASVTIAATFPDEDALDIRSFTSPGSLRPGATATLWLGVTYTVVTAAAGELRVQLSDQDGAIAAGTPLSVSRGADVLTLSTTATVPQGSTRVCAVAILQVNSITIAAPADPGRFCVSVNPD